MRPYNMRTRNSDNNTVYCTLDTHSSFYSEKCTVYFVSGYRTDDQ